MKSELPYALPPLRLGLFFQSLAHGPKALSLVMSSQALNQGGRSWCVMSSHMCSQEALAQCQHSSNIAQFFGAWLRPSCLLIPVGGVDFVSSGSAIVNLCCLFPALPGEGIRGRKTPAHPQEGSGKANFRCGEWGWAGARLL